MDPIKEMSPSSEVLEFYRDYMLRGVKNLNNKERAVYCKFLETLLMPKYMVDPSRVNIEDLVRSKPGAIIRVKPGD